MVVPAEIQGLPVKSVRGLGRGIVSAVFADGIETVGGCAYDTLETVVLPSTLKVIETKAFNGCTALRAVEFPASLKAIGVEAFAGSGLEEVQLPEGLVLLGGGAFNRCENLTALSLPKSLRFLHDGWEDTRIMTDDWKYTVRGIAASCDRLEHIAIPDGFSVARLYVHTLNGYLNGYYRYDVSSYKGDLSDLISGTKIKESVALQKLLKDTTYAFATDDQKAAFRALLAEYGFERP